MPKLLQKLAGKSKIFHENSFWFELTITEIKQNLSSCLPTTLIVQV